MEQARDLALAHTPKATQPPPEPTWATPEGAEHVNTFLKEALATALRVQILLESIKRAISNCYILQGNEDLWEMVGQHEAVAMEATTRIDEIEAERNSYFTNAVALTSHFREMQDRYKHPQEIKLASLEALKERLAKKSGVPASKPSTTKQTKAARGEPGIQGISPNTL